METLFNILDARMPWPSMYGWFHLLWFALAIGAGVFLCIRFPQGTSKQVRAVVLTVAILVTVLEIYKQIVLSFSYHDGAVTFSYPWYIFPWQFCSMPLYVGLLAGITKKGRLHDALHAFLATFAAFGGLCVMLYPSDVFTDQIGINIQTMVCHGSMLTVGIYLLYTGYVKREHKTILKAMPVFAAAVGVAVLINEVCYHTHLLDDGELNLFFVSPHAPPHLPVYSAVQAAVPYPWCLMIYVAVFTLAAYLILLISMGIAALCTRVKRK